MNLTTSFIALLLITGLCCQVKGSDASSMSEPDMFSPLTDSNLKGVQKSAVAWGDFDRDGDLDFVIAGDALQGQSLAPATVLYRNDGASNFVEVTMTELTAVTRAALAWGDYNNDGYLDLILSGQSASGGIGRIYRNEYGTNFVDSGISLPGALDGTAEWGDFDNDGDVDILLAGGGMSKIFRNDGATNFVDISAGLPGLVNGDAHWGDFDRDGDLDVLLAGLSLSGRIARVYENQGGTNFANKDVNLVGVNSGSAAWGDFDNDGYLDVLIAGATNDISRFSASKVYRNQHGTNFMDMGFTALTPVFDGSVAWGDYDNDGYLDILLTGWTGTAPLTRVYRNQSGTNFVDAGVSNIASVFESAVTWSDFDRDGDLDILITGASQGGVLTQLYQNNQDVPNMLPQAPTGLAAIVEGNGIILSWEASTDTETPSAGLSYNLILSRSASPGAGDILSPLADVQDGFRQVVALGNAQHNTSWRLGNLPLGDYSWRVQAIDSSFAGSAFSSEETFSVGAEELKILDVFLNDLDQVTVIGMGNPNQEYHILASMDFEGWTDLGVAMSDGEGRFEFVDSDSTALPRRFYRAFKP